LELALIQASSVPAELRRRLGESTGLEVVVDAVEADGAV
jgi:hypothetical protein